MSRIVNVLLLLLNPLAMVFSQGDRSYWVEFCNKGTSFDPFSYFDPKAIERRLLNGINLCDSTDFPVNETYERALEECGAMVVYSSRWLNATYVKADEQTIERIRLLPFVKETTIALSQLQLAKRVSGENDDNADTDRRDELAYRQIAMMNGFQFTKNDITGRGVRIAVFDGGFPNVDVHRAFDRIRKKENIVATFDFTKNKPNVYRGSSHGLATLSNIGGYYVDNQLLGLAPDAEYLLAITEINREILKEEVWWVAAAEWADKNGAHIINSSLGYTEPRYTPLQMDGHYTMVTRAANMAASKGILVINSAGNEGVSPGWQIIGAPADADSVLSVGGVRPSDGLKINFSSFGPTAHRRMKPNVVASGTTVAASGKNGYKVADGTSFSAPLVSGFAACVMQMKQGLKTMEYFDLIQQSAHLYPYFDYAHGYGVPQATFFFKGKAKPEPTFVVKNGSYSDIGAKFIIPESQKESSKDKRVFNIRLTRDHETTSEFQAFDYFYYHLADDKGELLDYKVLIPEREFTLYLTKPEAVIFRAFYKGYFVEINLK